MYKAVFALFVAAAVATAGEKGQAPAKGQDAAPAKKAQDAAPAKKGQAATKGEVVVVKEKKGLFAGLRSRRASANCNCE
jgi:hypothetical protein